MLLAGWRRWGAALLPRLEGMFAFALWDPACRALVLARDRFGKKPLAWARDGNRLCFASDAVALDRLRGGAGEIDPRALVEADLYVCDRVSQCEVVGELGAARAVGLMARANPPELGAIVAGAPGRKSENDVTICDLTGTGAQDTAIATHAAHVLGSAGTVITA